MRFSMKTISRFNCGPAFADARVNLVVYDSDNQNDLKEIQRRFKKKRAFGGHVYFKDFQESCWTKPICVIINKRVLRPGGDELSKVFRTLPHEITHLIGALAEWFNISAMDEPCAYLCGSVTKQFQLALLQHLGYEIIKKGD